MTYDDFLKRYQFDTQDKKALLGTGGFASVYKAFDTVQKRFVAVKIAEVKHEKFNLQYEKQIVDELDSHENIVRYGNCYRFQFMPVRYDFAILNFYEEGNLNDVIHKYALTFTQKHQIISGILKGIAHLHRHHIIHRDMKPQNILMERSGDTWIPKLTDFGLSKLADTNTRSVENSAIGLSVAYAAPEQIQNQDIRPNVDLWAAGVCAYHLFVGELPFDASRTMSQESWNLEISKQIIKGKLSDKIKEIPEPYRTIIKKCLTPDNTKRVQKAEDLLKLLENIATPSVKTPAVPVNDDATIRVDEPMLNVKEWLEKANARAQAAAGLVGFSKEQALREAIKDYEEILKIDAQNAVARRQIEKCRAELVKKETPTKPLPLRKYTAITAAAAVLIGFLFYWNWQSEGKEKLRWAKTTHFANINYNDTATVYAQIYQILDKYAGTWLMDDTTNNMLGIFYQNGRGGAALDIEKALDYYEKVDDYHWGFYNIGYIYYFGVGGKTRDYVEALNYFEEAEKKGSIAASAYIGSIYLSGGYGVTSDLQKAKKYYEKGAGMGEKWAQYQLGRVYENGWGVAKNEDMAARYYRLAADQGIHDAQTALSRVSRTAYANYRRSKPRQQYNSGQSNNNDPVQLFQGAVNSLLRKR
ncbi:MAG: serine/threonine-protein kinase [Spirosomataceae bacterium]